MSVTNEQVKRKQDIWNTYISRAIIENWIIKADVVKVSDLFTRNEAFGEITRHDSLIRHKFDFRFAQNKIIWSE